MRLQCTSALANSTFKKKLKLMISYVTNTVNLRGCDSIAIQVSVSFIRNVYLQFYLRAFNSNNDIKM